MSKTRVNGSHRKREIKIKPIEPQGSYVSEEETEQIIESAEERLVKLKAEIEKLEESKRILLKDTREQITEEKKKLEEKKKNEIEKANQIGYQDGLELGKEEGKQLYHDTIMEANKIVDIVKEDYHQTLEKTEEVIIELAIHTAEKILLKRLEKEPEDFVDIVREALKEIRNQPVISIYLHPRNYEFVLEQKTELKQIVEKDTKLSLYIYEDLKENACVIEHPHGQVNASIDTQLMEIRNALMEVMESSS